MSRAWALARTLLIARLMKLHMGVLLVAVGLGLTIDRTSAHADDWSSGDTVYATLSGAGGGVGGAGLGGLAGSLLDGGCNFSSTDDCVPAFTLAGIASGLIIGTASGVSWYGKRRGKRGSFRAALVGSLLGHLASGSVVVLAAATIDNGAIGFPVVFAAMVGMPAIGSTIAYRRSIDPEQPPSSAPTSGALIDVSADGVIVGPPAIGFAVTPRETVVTMPLAAGRF
jgi:hypothetical protein